MTVNAARRPRRRAAEPVPEPIVAPAESIAIGEIDQTVFDCPKCGRPLAMGARRCPGCRTRLVMGVPMSKASVIGGGGLLVGLLFGASAGVAIGFASRSAVAPPAPPVVIPSTAPIGGGGGTLATPVPIPSVPSGGGGGSTGSGMPAVSRSALTQAITVNEHLHGAAASLSAAINARSFDASEVAQTLRAISAETVYAQQLAVAVAGWSGSAEAGGRLSAAYAEIHDAAAEALIASVRNEAAYRGAAKSMVALLAQVRSVDAELRDLAAANGVALPGASAAP